MADEKKVPEAPIDPPKATTPETEEKAPVVTDNPGEGSYMFSDWAML